MAVSDAAGGRERAAAPTAFEKAVEAPATGVVAPDAGADTVPAPPLFFFFFPPAAGAAVPFASPPPTLPPPVEADEGEMGLPS